MAADDPLVKFAPYAGAARLFEPWGYQWQVPPKDPPGLEETMREILRELRAIRQALEA